MDIVLALAFAFGLTYAMIRGARWAFKIDKEEARRREALSRREAHRINETFEDIANRLRNEK